MRTISLTPYKNLRRSAALLVCGALSVLCGCQQRLTPIQQLHALSETGEMRKYMFKSQIIKMDKTRYLRELKDSLVDSVFYANTNRLEGQVQLSMELDRYGNVLYCRADPMDAPPSIELAHLIQDACWSSERQPIPEGLQQPNDGGLTVVAPLRVYNRKHDQAAEAKLTGGQRSILALSIKRTEAAFKRTAQERFLWSNLFASLPIATPGIAYFSILANNEANVLECNVKLDSTTIHPQSFHPDQPFQEQLAQSCRNLDLRKMPGYQASPDGHSYYFISVKYLPSMKNIGHYDDNTAR